MRKHTARLSTVVAALAVVVLTAVVSFAQPKGATVTIKGAAVDLWCYMEGGDRGPAKKECATACAKSGNSIGIVDAKGQLYVAAGLQDHQPAQRLLVERMSDEV